MKKYSDLDLEDKEKDTCLNESSPKDTTPTNSDEKKTNPMSPNNKHEDNNVLKNILKKEKNGIQHRANLFISGSYSGNSLNPEKSAKEERVPNNDNEIDDDDEETEDESEDEDTNDITSDEDDNEGVAYAPSIGRPSGLHRGLSRQDADSIVGGHSVSEYEDQSKIQPNEIMNSTSDNAHVLEGTLKDDYDDTQKVFSFSLPFGGLSSIKSNIYKQLHSLKLDSLPIGNNNNNEKRPLSPIQRLPSVSTIEEAKYFAGYKGVDDVRFRAVKHSLTPHLNESFLDIIHTNRKEKPYESIYNEISGNIVILGGYRGSTLRDVKTNKRVWIPFKAGLKLRTVNLLLGPTLEDELDAPKRIYSDGILKNVGPVDICKKLLKKLLANPKTNVKDFGYDWRLSGEVVSRQFEEFLLEIFNLTGKPIIVLAHSMGGMIAHLVMQRNPGIFRGLVYIGCPSECLNILGPIRFGDSVFFSDKILTFETNFMMRSSFNFLPLSGRVFMDKNTHEYYDLDFFDPHTWVEYNLNPLVSLRRKLLENKSASPEPLTSSDTSLSFPSINSLSSKLLNYRSKSLRLKGKSRKPNISTSSDSQSNLSNPKDNLVSDVPSEMESSSLDSTHFFILFNEAYKYLQTTLKSTKEFLLSLVYKDELADEYPPLAIVYGNRVPSVRGSLVNGRQDIKDGNYYEFFYGHGDGVIHQKWLLPENNGFKLYNETTGEGHIVGKFASSCGHVNLMTDHKAVGYALYSIVEAEKNWHMEKRKHRKTK